MDAADAVRLPNNWRCIKGECRHAHPFWRYERLDCTFRSTHRPGQFLQKITIPTPRTLLRCAQVFIALSLFPAPALAQIATPVNSSTPSTLPQPDAKNDWAYLRRYRDANAELFPPLRNEKRVVFYGNSITQSWAKYFPAMFPGKPYVNRGISGQTTPQMLVRFRQDVVALKPHIVVILAGTNDIAGNTGPSNLGMIEDNIASMTEIAKANGIRVVLSSVLPVFDYPWKPGLNPAMTIVALNAWIKSYARKAGAVYLDYHSNMADEKLGL
nr:hypothetical protein [Gemmatimonadaceae bacterium]